MSLLSIFILAKVHNKSHVDVSFILAKVHSKSHVDVCKFAETELQEILGLFQILASFFFFFFFFCLPLHGTY